MTSSKPATGDRMGPVSSCMSARVRTRVYTYRDPVYPVVRSLSDMERMRPDSSGPGRKTKGFGRKGRLRGPLGSNRRVPEGRSRPSSVDPATGFGGLTTGSGTLPNGLEGGL